MSDAPASKSSFGMTFLAAVGGFVIFVVILLVAYLPKQPAPLGDGIKTPAQRKAALAELRAHDAKVATGYGWIDQSKGIVQLPVDRAMELTLRDIEAKSK